MKRLVLFVEGEGDALAVPKIVSRRLTDLAAWDAILLDGAAFRVDEVHTLIKNDFEKWKRLLQACLKRKNVGAVLLLLDGDAGRINGIDFCAASVARSLAREARTIGAGTTFTVAVVFACQEYETWFIAGLESLVGRTLPDGRVIDARATRPATNLEESPRNAKGWIGGIIQGGYKPTRDQHVLSDLIDFQCIRDQQLRSFQRFESALSQIVSAIRSETHLATPE